MTASDVPFIKMNGLGNDFVIIDARKTPVALTGAQVARIADRTRGVGCDQLIVLEPAQGMDAADIFMRIYNQEGGEVDACGNATRCVASLLMEETGKDHAVIITNAGMLVGRHGARQGTVTVDMGRPKFGWQDIPLSEAFHDTRGIELQLGPIDAPLLHTPSVVNVGNPHAIFWVADLNIVDLEKAGPLLENHPMFPERANISLARVDGADAMTLKVWERGVGQTLACGTAACAAAVAGARKRLTGRSATVTLPGGPLHIEWREGDDHILMTGPFTHDHDGVIPGAWLN
ncbi:MAG: diaminopimelate epimerase [Pseudomonadota bacterium]